MQKLIRGKLYDTNRAQCIAIKKQNESDPDKWLESRIYQTSKGNLFLYAKGGPCSSEKKLIDAGEGKYFYSEGEDIYPIEDPLVVAKILVEWGYADIAMQHFKIEEA